MSKLNRSAYHHLPVYQQKEKILSALREHSVVIVESPTGSGKTTQIPIILHEAGYTQEGIIGITQPRRIATLSVSSFLAQQTESLIGDFVGYKMRFEDATSPQTRIKVLTDGTLLQELKADLYLHQYSVLIVDEAHERSLNIDFILGLLQVILKKRPHFKVIISSATINTRVFSNYFGGAPIVSIQTKTFPVQVIYHPIAEETPLERNKSLEKNPDQSPQSKTKRSSNRVQHFEKIVSEIVVLIENILNEGVKGDILIFLPGERLIKMTLFALQSHSHLARKLLVLPLYSRLSAEEQQQIFKKTPFGKKKVVIATNIAETSLTIEGIAVVIDSGLVNMNHYNPQTFASSLIETEISQASAQQRTGRAGRTQAGLCYRLYRRDNFQLRARFTPEEIDRTDLSEVVIRMIELGIDDVEHFSFISPPSRVAIKSALETLKILGAIDEQHKLSDIGKVLIRFPLVPRHARILYEALRYYPHALYSCTIAVSFLSNNSPFIFPTNEEDNARKAHQSLHHEQGDFTSFLVLFENYDQLSFQEKTRFCQRFYIDRDVIDEIVQVQRQLTEILAEIGITFEKHLCFNDDYLICLCVGLVQFICHLIGHNTYTSLTVPRIQIHPSSGLFGKGAAYIVAGEIVRTSRVFARSVSVIRPSCLQKLPNTLISHLKYLAQQARQENDRSSKRHFHTRLKKTALHGTKKTKLTKPKNKAHRPSSKKD